MRRTLLFLLALAALPWPARAQEVPAISEARVREVVSFLASDDLMGRDSPSPGLTAAADYIAARFAATGLEKVADGSWLQRYELPGQRVDSSKVVVRVAVAEAQARAERDLAPGTDVRLLRAGEAASGEKEPATVACAGDARVDRLLLLHGGRRPVLIEVDEDHPSWRAAAAAHELLGRPARGSRPVFLVRKGALPPCSKPDEAEFTVTWTAAPQPVDVELGNVVGVLRGASKPDEYVVVSAHYDHIGISVPVHGDAICNGADDDASGTTAVVLLAEALARRQPRPARSIAFVCFSAEEKGLLGSAAFAERPPFPLDHVVADVNIEMIGRPQDGRQRCAWITGSDYSDFAAIAGPALHRAGVELVPFEMGRQLFAASDNLSFARRGVVAHSISAGSLHADYHQPSDEVGKLDLPHMTAVIAGLEEVALEFANREQRPAWTDQGRQVLERLAMRRR